MIRSKSERTLEIIKRLKKAYPSAHCALNHTNAFELLIATILSAQCTDERVNIVTADLFREPRERCRAAGINDQVAKPIVPGELLERIAAHMDLVSTA